MRAFFLLVVLLCGLARPAAAMPPAVRAVDRSADDHPAQALLQADRAAAASAAGSPERFWWLLVRSRLLSRLERSTEAAQSAQQAAALWSSWAQVSEETGLWLRVAQAGATISVRPSNELLREMTALRERAEALGLPDLACDVRGHELWLLQDLRSFDEAWSMAEAVERCGQTSGWAEQQASALLVFGTLTSLRLAEGETGLAPERHFERALQVLGTQPARFLRSLLAWEAGNALRHQKRFEPALERLHEARRLSAELDDRAGIAVAAMELAATLLELQRPAEMLPLLDEAARLVATGGDDDAAFRMPRVMELRILALVRLGGPRVLDAVAEARRWVERSPSPQRRADLQRAMAEGLASQGRPAEAYTMLLAAQATGQQARATARDTQVMRLQARYENARRDAETAELRRRHNEAARLEIEKAAERSRALLAGVVALALLAVLGFSFGGRELARRRRMADLALRDELTGLPNRRAVQVYAHEQFEQSLRLDLPFAVAIIDFDHFKQVNDRFGHAAGDAVLRAFGQAGTRVLRGQDRLGRWGGEEWLLVMPGTRLAEIDGVFQRLRERFRMMLIPGVPAALHCTFSMGAAERQPGASLDATIAAADEALYRAKQAGRDRLAHAPPLAA